MALGQGQLDVCRMAAMLSRLGGRESRVREEIPDCGEIPIDTDGDADETRPQQGGCGRRAIAAHDPQRDLLLRF